MLPNFVIECDKQLDYIEDLNTKLLEESSRILSFFELDGLKEPKKIKIWTDRTKYQQYLEQYVDKYYEWMNGDTYDGNINMLSIEECRKTSAHSDMTLEEFLTNICHEFVHSCQQEINSDDQKVEWFWEALATNLANPFDHVASIQCEDDELINNLNGIPYNYEICFTIGKYLLENYSHEQIMNWVKNPDKLRHDTKRIFNETRNWFHEQYLPLPSTPKAENSDFKIFVPDTLADFAKECLPYITEQKEKILEFFGIDKFRKIEINLFDNQETFINFIKKLRWQGAKIPSYCKGTFDNFMVNVSLNPVEVSLNPERYKRGILHECIHIIYNSITNRRITWLDEGLAMNLSGEKDRLLDDEHLKDFMTMKVLPRSLPNNINTLTHGELFANEEYDGYDLSYLAVRYLLETKSKEEIHEIIKDGNKVLEIGQDVLPEAIHYFSNKLSISANKKTVI